MGYWKQFSGSAGGRRAAKNSPIVAEIRGDEELQEIFEKMPARYAKKPVTATFRKGANEYNRALKANIPSSMSSLKKLVKVKVAKRGITVIAGAFANVGTVTTRRGKEFDAFFLLYWSNYGTLQNRHAAHRFDRPRKRISAAWKGGIRPQLFAERAWETSKDRAMDTINNEIESETLKFLNKYKVEE